MNWTRGLLLFVLAGSVLTPATGAEPSEPPISIGVSPPRFEIEIGSVPVTKAARVFNFGTKPLEIKASVHGWELDEKNQVQLVEPTEQSLDQWIVINPLRFTVQPGESQTVRFSVRPKVRPEPGEHRAIIYFEQPPSNEGSIAVVGRIGVAVYGYVGPVTRLGELNGIAVDAKAAAPVAGLDITSLGTAHVRLGGQYAIWPAAAYPGVETTRFLPELGEREIVLPEAIVDVGFLPALPVLPGDRRTLPLYLPPGMPPGEYVLDINGNLSGEPLDLAVPFTVASGDVPRAAVESN